MFPNLCTPTSISGLLLIGICYVLSKPLFFFTYLTSVSLFIIRHGFACLTCLHIVFFSFACFLSSTTKVSHPNLIQTISAQYDFKAFSHALSIIVPLLFTSNYFLFGLPPCPFTPVCVTTTFTASY